jgi:hypothetical protein
VLLLVQGQQENDPLRQLDLEARIIKYWQEVGPHSGINRTQPIKPRLNHDGILGGASVPATSE